MKRYFVYLVLLLCAIACRKKEKIVEVEKEVIVYKEPQYKWKKVIAFEQTNCEFIKTAARTKSGFILFTSMFYDVVFDSAANKFSTLMVFGRDKQLKPLITGEYKTFLSDNSVTLIPLNKLPGYPVNYSEKYIIPSQLDSTFVGFYIWNTVFQGEICGSENTVLIEYDSKATTAKRFIALRLKTDPESPQFGGSYFIIEKTKMFEDRHPVLTDRFIGPCGENLLFMMGSGKNYLINSSLDTVYINNTYGFNDLFSFKKAHYSFAGANSNLGSDKAGQTCLIKSSDNGTTWQEVVCGLQFDLRNLNYEQIGDKLIGFSFGNQIWEIVINDNNIIMKELNNDGLVNKRIKAITMSNNRVFISTESGVFERPYAEFIEYK